MSAENQNLSLGRMEITDDLGQLLIILPEAIRVELEQHPKLGTLVEVVLDLGRHPEARFPDGAEYISERVITKADLQFCIDRVGIFSGDNRAGIERTLHRISAMRNRSGEIIGLTCRVGRAIYGTINMIRDLVETGGSILMLGRPGVGKTTALREIARVLADELDKRVVIVDTSNEIAGDGDIPHPAIGRARRMQVARPELQHQVMIEAVENHMPQVIVIDEIGTELEALAARTIAERGVQLVGTAHGNQLANLIKNPTLSDLVGGIQAVTLGDDEARRRASQKTILERKAPPTFEIAVEMQERSRWVVHESVSEMVDNLLRGRQVTPQIRTVNDEGKVTITREPPTVDRNGLLPAPPLSTAAKSPPRGWRTDGRMMPPTAPAAAPMKSSVEPSVGFGQLLERDWDDTEANLYSGANLGPNGEDLPLHVYPYGISKQQLDQVIEVLNLPVVLTANSHQKSRQTPTGKQSPPATDL
jgi:stage III sporulation protein SpoIIIAA